MCMCMCVCVVVQVHGILRTWHTNAGGMCAHTKKSGVGEPSERRIRRITGPCRGRRSLGIELGVLAGAVAGGCVPRYLQFGTTETSYLLKIPMFQPVVPVQVISFVLEIGLSQSDPLTLKFSGCVCLLGWPSWQCFSVAKEAAHSVVQAWRRCAVRVRGGPLPVPAAGPRPYYSTGDPVAGQASQPSKFQPVLPDPARPAHQI